MSKFAKELKKRLADFKAGQGKVARVGIIEQQHYDDNTPVAYVAYIHEHGSKSNNIKPRPFFRPTISEKKNEWREQAKVALKGGKSIEEMLALVGDVAAEDVRITIKELMTPPLEESTIEARRRKARKHGYKLTEESAKKPLVDSTLLRESIGYDVIDKEP